MSVQSNYSREVLEDKAPSGYLTPSDLLPETGSEGRCPRLWMAPAFRTQMDAPAPVRHT